jgi:tripartite-type tricarboxylate transporter receptor subunit TctC
MLLVAFFNPWSLDAIFAQANFYQGKTITMVVSSTAGGGYDLWARLMAQHIVKYIPGNPTIVVQNMPGAGNIIGANYVYGIAKPDGLTLGAVNPALYFDQLVGRPEVKFDWTKFNWIGSPEKNDIVSYMRADQPIKSVEAWRNAKEPPKCGSTGTGSTGHYIPRLLEETLGIKTQIVSGYPGAGDIELAVERG